MHDSQLMGVSSPEFREMFERVKVATRLSAKLSSYSMDEAESIRESFQELIGKPVGEPFTLIPPFYADFGLNITVGREVFIGYECAFTGHAAIDIGDEVMIAHRVNLVTAGHPVEVDKTARLHHRGADHDRNERLDRSCRHDLPGVTIGKDAVVAAGAVVTHDVPPATLVAGARDGHSEVVSTCGSFAAHHAAPTPDVALERWASYPGSPTTESAVLCSTSGGRAPGRHCFQLIHRILDQCGKVLLVRFISQR